MAIIRFFLIHIKRIKYNLLFICATCHLILHRGGNRAMLVQAIIAMAIGKNHFLSNNRNKLL